MFNTAPLTAVEFALRVACAVAVFAAVEAEKWLVRCGVLYAEAQLNRVRVVATWGKP